MLEVADDIAIRTDDVFGLRADALLVRRTHLGTARASGGAYERLLLLLCVFGADGLVTRIEYFDVDRDAEALARFDELTAASSGARFENVATRTMERGTEAWRTRDWEGFAATFAESADTPFNAARNSSGVFLERSARVVSDSAGWSVSICSDVSASPVNASTTSYGEEVRSTGISAPGSSWPTSNTRPCGLGSRPGRQGARRC